MERKVLGKGLDALIPQKVEKAAPKEFTYLPVAKIKPGRYQPRQRIDAQQLKELTLSIQEQGFIQPIVVRKIGPDSYEVVAGGRRFSAAKSLGHKEIPTVVKELTDKDALVLAIVENLQRSNLNPLDEAEAFKRLMDEFRFHLEDVARFVSKDKTTIANTLRLLKLPEEIQEALRQEVITRSQARTILSVDTVREQKRLFHEILKEGLTVREIEKRAKRVAKKKKKFDPFVADMEDKLQKALGTKVRIFHLRNNRGKIVVEYYNLDDLTRITRRMG